MGYIPNPQRASAASSQQAPQENQRERTALAGQVFDKHQNLIADPADAASYKSMMWQSNVIFVLTAPVFPIALLLGRRLQKDTSQAALSAGNTRMYKSMIAYSLTMFLLTGVQEWRRNKLTKALADKYLAHSTNDHLKALAGSQVANSSAPYASYSPQMMTMPGGGTHAGSQAQLAEYQRQTEHIER